MLPSMFMVGIIGLIVGGLTNYIANLLLQREGLISYPAIASPCSHKLEPAEAIPGLPLLLLAGKCRQCWQRLTWQYALVEILTATIFLVLAWHFGLGPYAIGMMIFVSVLITICITDFKAKIIPHEITYPAILAGIIFSALTKADMLGVLAGIGVSYILFDFLAFYGLEVYLWLNKPTLGPHKQFVSKEGQSLQSSSNLGEVVSNYQFNPLARSAPKQQNIGAMPVLLSRESQPKHMEFGAKQPRLGARLYCKGIPVEELEIIGGGDAVLSALISAWLGWQKLVLAIFVSFLIGTILGAVYVLVALWKERLMKTIIVPIILAVLGSCCLAALMLIILAVSLRQPIFNMPFLYILPWGAFVGCLLGVIIAGTRVSRPFPFGPALAAGALIAIFRD